MLVVDTSSWIEYLAGRGDALRLEEALALGQVYLPPMVAAELLSGRLEPSERKELEDLLVSLPRCATELEHWFRVGVLRSALRSKGVSISTPDAHVAQCALDLDAHLMSEDKIFHVASRYCRLRLIESSARWSDPR